MPYLVNLGMEFEKTIVIYKIITLEFSLKKSIEVHYNKQIEDISNLFLQRILCQSAMNKSWQKYGSLGKPIDSH